MMASSGGTASLGLSSATALTDGTKRVYLSGDLSVPTAGYSIDLLYDPAYVKIKAAYTTLKTQGLEVYFSDDLKGHAKIGMLKSDGSKLINSGSGSLLDLRLVGTNLTSVRLMTADSANQYGKDMGVSIYQATVPSSLKTYTPTKSTTTLY